jgi:hypothetical protein
MLAERKYHRAMTAPQTVLIYGNSLFVAGVAGELRDVPGLTIERIDSAGLQTHAQLHSTCPSILIVDLATTPADLILHCLIDCPTLVLVGLDLRNNRVMVLNRQFFPVTTLHELTQVIQGL